MIILKPMRLRKKTCKVIEKGIIAHFPLINQWSGQKERFIKPFPLMEHRSGQKERFIKSVSTYGTRKWSKRMVYKARIQLWSTEVVNKTVSTYGTQKWSKRMVYKAHFLL
ncbi:hypothetical protein COE25_27995 [Bacillus sp. AFS031507]|nr:hypothetical protein COE25_27995 [Bacillus sp. AFS031507]